MYRRFTPASDVWSWGILGLEIFTDGMRPFAGVHNAVLPQRISAGLRPSQPPMCPDRTFELLKQCWDAEPSQRPTFEELVTACEKLANDAENLAASSNTNDLLRVYGRGNCKPMLPQAGSLSLSSRSNNSSVSIKTPAGEYEYASSRGASNASLLSEPASKPPTRRECDAGTPQKFQPRRRGASTIPSADYDSVLPLASAQRRRVSLSSQSDQDEEQRLHSAEQRNGSVHGRRRPGSKHPNMISVEFERQCTSNESSNDAADESSDFSQFAIDTGGLSMLDGSTSTDVYRVPLHDTLEYSEGFPMANVQSDLVRGSSICTPIHNRRLLASTSGSGLFTALGSAVFNDAGGNPGGSAVGPAGRPHTQHAQAAALPRKAVWPDLNINNVNIDKGTERSSDAKSTPPTAPHRNPAQPLTTPVRRERLRGASTSSEPSMLGVNCNSYRSSSRTSTSSIKSEEGAHRRSSQHAPASPTFSHLSSSTTSTLVADRNSTASFHRRPSSTASDRTLYRLSTASTRTIASHNSSTFDGDRSRSYNNSSMLADIERARHVDVALSTGLARASRPASIQMPELPEQDEDETDDHVPDIMPFVSALHARRRGGRSGTPQHMHFHRNGSGHGNRRHQQPQRSVARLSSASVPRTPTDFEEVSFAHVFNSRKRFGGATERFGRPLSVGSIGSVGSVASMSSVEVEEARSRVSRLSSLSDSQMQLLQYLDDLEYLEGDPNADLDGDRLGVPSPSDRRSYLPRNRTADLGSLSVGEQQQQQQQQQQQYGYGQQTDQELQRQTTPRTTSVTRRQKSSLHRGQGGSARKMSAV